MIKKVSLMFFLTFIISAAAFSQDGKCTAGDCINGQGTIVYSDGSKYEGQWQKGLPNGKGTITYPGGDKYTGDIKDALPEGQGTYTYSDGTKYTGQWKNGEEDGQGTKFNSDGSIKHKGKFKKGKYISE